METLEKEFAYEDDEKSPLLRVNSFQNRISVFCRIRPPVDKNREIPYKIINEENTLELLQSIEVLNKLGAARYYRFTRVFEAHSTQLRLFEETCLPMLKDVFTSGLNALIFTYGVTNAGKTYTLVGNDENPGILRRTLEWLLSLRDNLYDQKSEEVCESYVKLNDFFGLCDNENFCSKNFIDLKVSLRCFEVYNDDIFDLFAPKNKRNKLKLKEGEDKRTVIDDIITMNIANTVSIKASLNKCLSARSIKDTLLNHSSSRSHCIFRIIVQFVFDNDQEELIFERTINIVDLAGAERARRTENTGIRLKEANKINQSLSCLGRCLSALRDGTLPPYRETKLTKFLAEFFLEHSCIAMVTNINPEESELEETARVLNYSALAREVPLLKSRYEFRPSTVNLSLKKPLDRVVVNVPTVANANGDSTATKELTSIDLRLAAIEEKLSRILADVASIKAKNTTCTANKALEEPVSTDANLRSQFTTRGIKYRAEHLLSAFKKKYLASNKNEVCSNDQGNLALFHDHADYSAFSTKDLAIIIQRKETLEDKNKDQNIASLQRIE